MCEAERRCWISFHAIDEDGSSNDGGSTQRASTMDSVTVKIPVCSRNDGHGVSDFMPASEIGHAHGIDYQLKGTVSELTTLKLQFRFMGDYIMQLVFGVWIWQLLEQDNQHDASQGAS